MTITPQTALTLTQEEWDDLEMVARQYLDATRWAERETATPSEPVRRRRDLSRRLIEANR